VAPIQEVSPSLDKSTNSILPTAAGQFASEEGTIPLTSITAMCQELSQGLSILAAKTDEDQLTTASTTTTSTAGTSTSFSAFGLFT